MNINELIKEAHSIAKDKGFYDCPECDGSGTKDYTPIPYSPGGAGMIGKCDHCNGTGIDPNKNIPELLMLIVSELSEALEAHRKYDIMYINIDNVLFLKDNEFVNHFEKHCKNSFQDEIADVFIRLFDLCGYLKIEIDESDWNDWPCGAECAQNTGEALFDLVEMIVNLRIRLRSSPSASQMTGMIDIFKYLLYFCQCNQIDIEKHIEAKMEYNKTREKLHNKKY